MDYKITRFIIRAIAWLNVLAAVMHLFLQHYREALDDCVAAALAFMCLSLIREVERCRRASVPGNRLPSN